MGIDFDYHKMNGHSFIFKGWRMNLVSKLGKQLNQSLTEPLIFLGTDGNIRGLQQKIDCFAEGLREIGVEKEIMLLCFSAIPRIL